MAAFGLRVALGPVLLLLLGSVSVLGAMQVQHAMDAIAMPPLLGGRYDIRVDSPEVAKATRTAVKAFNRASNDVHRSAVSNVISAQAQVVSGMLYHLTLELRTTVCRKRSASRNCPFQKNPRFAKRMTCRFKVWERAWLRKSEVTEQLCSK